jgi:hypothetical protein
LRPGRALKRNSPPPDNCRLRVRGILSVAFAALAAVSCIGIDAFSATPSSASGVRKPHVAYTPPVVTSAFARNGIDLCAVSACSGIRVGFGRAWETRARLGGAKYDVFVLLAGTASGAASSFSASAQDHGGAQARIHNLYVSAEKLPITGYHGTFSRRFPEAVRRAVQQIAGSVLGSDRQERVCRALAHRPWRGGPSAVGATCSGMPRSGDTEYRFVVERQQSPAASLAAVYRVYRDSRAAALNWPRDRQERRVDFAPVGRVAELSAPSVVWKGSRSWPNLSRATIRVGRVTATVDIESAGKRPDIATTIELARSIASRIRSVEAAP